MLYILLINSPLKRYREELLAKLLPAVLYVAMYYDTPYSEQLGILRQSTLQYHHLRVGMIMLYGLTYYDIRFKFSDYFSICLSLM